MSATLKYPVPQYIEARIRQRPPEGVSVVRGSTPVVSFGDVRKGRVATLGWNPSKVEFLDRNGNELTGTERRLETLSSLGESDLSSAALDTIRTVFEGCNGYFQRCPYRRWFNVLERILRPSGVSYYDGTACHLDLVQWATDPTWGKLQHVHKKTLRDADLPFLRQQLSQEHIRLLLLNGSGIAKASIEGLGCDLTETVISGKIGLKLFEGGTAQGTKVIGWNKNLQSSFGVSSEYIKAIGMVIEKARIDG
jgi:hypothetical protein